MATFILIKGAIVLPINPPNQVLYNHDILIEDSYIKSIAPNLALPSAGPNTTTTTIDASGCIVMPGFVNGHHHMWQHLLRGLTADWSLFGYACHLRTVYGSLCRPEDVHIANYAAALSLLNNGVTTVLDHCHIINPREHADAAVAGLKDSGIRGTFCYGFYSNPAVPGIPESVANSNNTFNQAQRMGDALRVRTQYFASNDPATSLLTFGVALDDPTNLTPDENVQGLLDARRLNPRIKTAHASVVSAGSPKPGIVQQLEHAGLMGRELVFSHGVWFTDAEIEAVRCAGAGVIGTPDTEIQMGMGDPIVWRAGDAGCRCGLGLDITSNQGNDFIAQMRLALQTQRGREYGHGYKQAVQRDLNRKAADLLRTTTLGGAEAMQLDSLIGSVEAGKKADLVVWRADGIETVPIVDPVATIVFQSSPKSIDCVLVDGKIVKQGGQLNGLAFPA